MLKLLLLKDWFRNGRLSNMYACWSLREIIQRLVKNWRIMQKDKQLWLWLPIYHSSIISSYASCPMIVRRSRNNEKKNDASEILLGAIQVSVWIIYVKNIFLNDSSRSLTVLFVIITCAIVMANIKRPTFNNWIDICILIYPLFLFFNWKRQLNGDGQLLNYCEDRHGNFYRKQCAFEMSIYRRIYIDATSIPVWDIRLCL